MNKYRIVKIEHEGERGKYLIQKKGLLGYRSYRLRFAHICPLNLQWGYFPGCKLERTIYIFYSEKEALKALDGIKNTFREEYYEGIFI